MRLSVLSLVALLVITTAHGQQADVNKSITDLFGSSGSNKGSFLDGYEEVTTQGQKGFGAIQKCGEGTDAGKNRCVPYFNCDKNTNTIIESESFDGAGVIDIRFGSNPCENFLDKCCGIPSGGIPPNVITTSTTPATGGREPEPEPEPPVVDPTAPAFCGIRNKNGVDFMITGNFDNEAEYGEFPWMSAILKKNFDPSVDEVLAICGGSIISPLVILTGAHCVQKYRPSELKVRIGEWDTQTQRERYPYQERDIAQIIIHENFASTNLFNDVALIVLAKPIARAPHIGTICLPPKGIGFNARNCFATGWGKDVFGKEGKYQVILKKIQLPIVERNQCEQALKQTRLGQKFKLHSSFICAGGETGKDTCTGDGGSPLVCPDPSNPQRYYQAGLVAWGIGCGTTGVPGVYVDVSQFRDWIDNKMSTLNLDTSPYNV